MPEYFCMCLLLKVFTDISNYLMFKQTTGRSTRMPRAKFYGRLAQTRQLYCHLGDLDRRLKFMLIIFVMASLLSIMSGCFVIHPIWDYGLV